MKTCPFERPVGRRNIAAKIPVPFVYHYDWETVDYADDYCARAAFVDDGCQTLTEQQSSATQVDYNLRLDLHAVVDELEAKPTVENRLLLDQTYLVLCARRRGLYRVSWQHLEHAD